MNKSACSYLTDQLFSQNQILVAVLGLCSALGVTTRLSVALVMGVAVTFVTGFSSLFTSILRKKTPDTIRMVVQLAIISLFTIIVDQVLQAYYFSISKLLSVFVGLIITNCIVMGRTEGMAKNVAPWPAFLDGIGAGLGYSAILALVGVIREMFGFGELLGYRVIPLSWYATQEAPDGYRNISLMTVPTSAFFIIGCFIWAMNKYKMKYEKG